ncbi:hypothetical protein CKO12_11110 [Chromatium okenii]|uniref:class I SAM-dependent methyltransferase n=1 Tax=Chromatium okenii TaxID=61644 RepID=UPI0019045828|nr:class I SAM-dependent methyltransferase [Chromatium okenii]MBK1642415.1 hypothetical protein [Chromatium okenii]
MEPRQHQSTSKAEFDAFADEYDAMMSEAISTSGETHDYFHEYKIKDVAREYQKTIDAITAPVNILDFGSGTGKLIPFTLAHFNSAQITCLDVSKRSLDLAKDQFKSLADYVHFDGIDIPFPTGHFDIAYAMCVFHHIEPNQHVPLLKELRRVLRPKGSLFIFEHNPYNPLTVRVVRNCPLDENAQLITAGKMAQHLCSAGFSHAKIRYRVFFPHVLRAVRPLEALFSRLPLGAQYYIMSQK